MKCSSCEAEQRMQKKNFPTFLLKEVFPQVIFRKTEIKPLWSLLSVEWYRCQLQQPGVYGSLNQGPGTTWWCIHKAADKQRAMARQGHVFCPEIGHLCLFAQRKTQSWKWFRLYWLSVCLIWETAARSRAALCTLFYSDINQRWGGGGNKCQICCS